MPYEFLFNLSSHVLLNMNIYKIYFWIHLIQFKIFDGKLDIQVLIV